MRKCLTKFSRIFECGEDSFPGPCVSSGGRLPEALLMVFQLDSKDAKVCKSCRSRQELSNEVKFSFFSLSPCPFFSIFFSNQIDIQTHIYLQKLASIQPRTRPLKFARSSGDRANSRRPAPRRRKRSRPWRRSGPRCCRPAIHRPLAEQRD